MNSGELKVDVPLAVEESDGEDLESNCGGSTNPKKKVGLSPRFNLEGGGSDSIAASLEGLVNSFDEKLTMCFQDYQEQVDKIAPVQVRSQEEIMNECQVWWTITGNFGNMMPIDWSKSTARSKQLNVLNLCAPHTEKPADLYLEEEDDLVAADLDMHTLILNSNAHLQEPVKTADEVIKEIDDLIDQEVEEEENRQMQPQQPPIHLQLPHSTRIVNQVLQGRKLQDLSVNELTQIYGDMEILVRDLSEELVMDLGVRDELEFEKELRNTFISLLLSIQSKRRQISSSSKSSSNSIMGSKYLTTVIPYQPERGSPQVSSLQVLVKILKAINEDSPAVPALLTDYILKVLCPS